MTTPLTTYLTNTVGSTLASTYQLSTTAGIDNTNVTQDYTLLSTSLGWGQIYAQGTTNPWAAAGSIGSPDGKGFMLEATTLNLAGQTIIAGSWSAVVRLSIGHSDGSLGGTIVGDIHVRAFKYSSGIYTAIIDMALTNQTIPTTSGTIVSYTLSGTTGSGTAFVSGDLLYIDLPLNVTSNVTADTLRAIRLNRISTNFTGDSQAAITSPGFNPTPGGAHGVSFVMGVGLLPGYIPALGGSL